MKRASEGLLGEALRELDLEPYVYRLPDPKTGAGVSNWKPCDFMVWWRAVAEHETPERIVVHPYVATAWIEAKDTDQLNSFPYADLRPSQIAGMLEAGRLGIPYILAVYWRKARVWSLSDAPRVLEWFNHLGADHRPTSIPRDLLMSRFGVDSEPRNLPTTIKVILEDGW